MEKAPPKPRTKAPSVQSTLDEPGRPLDGPDLKYFQSGFGHDLSSVRLHTGERAAASAASLSARAYTVGRHIVLGRSEYAPGTAAGRHVLGHELAHVIQQSRGTAAASTNEMLALDASADYATNQLARGHRVSVAGSSGVQIACLTLFEEFSAGKYSWPLLKAALTHTRPVDEIIADVNALTPAERDQAEKDIAAERAAQAAKRDDLKSKMDSQADPALKAVFPPMLQTVLEVIARADEVLDGVSGTVALSETRASLTSGTITPTAADKPKIERALKPELRTTPAGAPLPFEENLPGDPKSYLDKLKDEMPRRIAAHYKQQVENRGKSEHADPNKVHALSEFERIGNASKRETDKVFGQFLDKPRPPMKADTKTSRGNIHDLWQDTDTQLKAMGPSSKRDMARALVFYFLQNDREIALINRAHNADPTFSKDNAPLNQEAKDQKQVVDDANASPASVQQLNEIDRGWDATADPATHEVNVQVFKRPDEATGPLAGANVADRFFLWDMFQTLIHEYLHTLAHPAYNAHADSFGRGSKQNTTLVEGVDSLLDEIVWKAVLPHVNDQALRDDVEGPAYSKLSPFSSMPVPRRYPSYSEAVKLVGVVGIRNLYAAYFLGDVKKISG
ncbi:MAG: DUF4157 domain-containing protein [Candidatus Cybelea sp.]